MKLKNILKSLSFVIVFFLLFTSLCLQPVKADGYKDRSLFFPKETNIYDKSGRKVGTEKNNRLNLKNTPGVNPPNYDQLWLDNNVLETIYIYNTTIQIISQSLSRIMLGGLRWIFS